MMPLAVLVAISRVYLGVHYPSDVLAGLLAGAVTGWVVTQTAEKLWHTLGRHVFPSWWSKHPSLLRPNTESNGMDEATASTLSWRHATWLLLLVLFAGRLAYIASDTIGLSEDEAYQWMWSKHLDWAYYSKPPMIAWIQWLGTHLWGDTVYGIRFFSPVLALAFGFMARAFLRTRTSEKWTFWTLAAFAVTPLFAVGSTLLTVDAPTVCFHTAAVLAMWIAIEKGSYHWWCLSGVCMALGFLSKFFSPFLWLGFGLFLLWAPEYRKRIGWRGPVTALALNALGAVPVIYWNAAHGWITLTHLQERGGLDHPSGCHPEFLGAFAGSVAGLMNPVFCIASAMALWGFLRFKEKPPLWKFLACSSVPVFLFYLVLAVRAKAQPNWIAPVTPVLFLFTALWWHHQSQTHPGSRWARRLLALGMITGFPLVLLLHNTHLLTKAFGITLSEKADPLTRVRQGQPLADLVARHWKALSAEGKPVFLISDHYGRASLLNFHLPEARLSLPDEPLSYVLSTDHPQNQYWFWPSYTERVGENAIFVMNASAAKKAPRRLREEFNTVNSLGVYTLRNEGRAVGHVQLFACHGYRLPGTPPDTAPPELERAPDIEAITAKGVALYSEGKFAEAAEFIRAVIPRCETAFGPEHPQVLANRNNLANSLNALGKAAEAETEHQKVLAIRLRFLGADHNDVLMSRTNLATALLAQGKAAEAAAQYKQVLQVRTRVSGAEDAGVLKTCYALALCLEAQQKFPEALNWIKKAEAGWAANFGDGDPHTLKAKTVRERIVAKSGSGSRTTGE